MPLGIGLTSNPAADVQGVLTEKGTEEHKALAEENLEKETISQNTNNTVKTKKVEAMKIENLKDITDESLQTLTASAIHEFIQESLKKASEEYSSQKTEHEESLNEAREKHETLSKEHDSLKTKLEDVVAQLEKLEAEKAEKDKLEAFNQRMASFDERFNLNDEDRKVLASQIKELDEEQFADFDKTVSVLLSSKARSDEDEAPAEEPAPAETPAEPCSSEAPAEEPAPAEASASVAEVVEEAVDNAEKKTEHGEKRTGDLAAKLKGKLAKLEKSKLRPKKRRFELRTISALIGVRGTKGECRAKGSVTELGTTDGQVEFSSVEAPDSITTVSAGQYSQVKEGSYPSEVTSLGPGGSLDGVIPGPAKPIDDFAEGAERALDDEWLDRIEETNAMLSNAENAIDAIKTKTMTLNMTFTNR